MGWNRTQSASISRILFSFGHELGVWGKQTSFCFQAKSCRNLNIFFNGPRAGINSNDTCRKSGDHGPFIGSDRQVYVTKVRDGTAQPDKEFD